MAIALDIVLELHSEKIYQAIAYDMVTPLLYQLL